MSSRESMHYEVVIVGAGVAGLATAIRLKQCNPGLGVCVLEKGSEVGAHILSGAVLDPRALSELLPDWADAGAPLQVPVRKEAFWLLGKSGRTRLPTALLPPAMRNHGNYIVSLANLCRWLAARAEALGVEIYPGFAAAEVLYDGERVTGVATGDMGRTRDGAEGPNFEPGMALHGRYTVFAEGCRGSLTKTLFQRYALDADCQPQTYGLGLKEIWEIPAANHDEGSVLHTVGWPLDDATYGGSFLYHQADSQLAVGFVVGLDYANPYLNPFEEFQRFKTHPAIRPLLEGGRRVAYGARALNEGGLQSIPRLVFPGGVLVGAAAGFLNVPRIKGSHTAMKSGMLAAEAIAAALATAEPPAELQDYPGSLRQSWVYKELRAARNVRPAFARFGRRLGLAYSGLDQWLGGRLPWTLSHAKPDYQQLVEKDAATPIAYPRPDGVLSFDRLSSVALSAIGHEENQPVHLRLRDPQVPVRVNLERFDAPEQRYCPAGVYEILDEGNGPRLQINAANCVHCKTCDIKDPTQNIDWVVPEGGGGPNYPNM
ncbi:MAG: electron transfer flavoprotein-ubiquinone oxidoreductase [Gammaproteobacteria bacterium]|nr:electron transfer flavoprotein-ubiquinone oxidoreductase [Gammaproteobacteria bacterium]